MVLGWRIGGIAGLAAVLSITGSPIPGENRILACWQHFFIFGAALGVASAADGVARFWPRLRGGTRF